MRNQKQITQQQHIDQSFTKRFTEAVISFMGRDYAAYLTWFMGVMFWQTGFLYYSEMGMGAFESTLSRGISLLLFNGVWVKLQGKEFISVYSLRYLNIRNILLVLYGYVFSQSMFYIPLTIVHTIFCSGPLFIFIIDYFVNKITVSTGQAVGVIIATLGSLLTINGPVLYTYFIGSFEGSMSHFAHYKTEDPFIKLLVGVILMICTFGWGYAQVTAKNIQRSTHYQSNFHLATCFVLISGLLYVFRPFKAVEDANKQSQLVQEKTTLGIFLLSTIFSGLVLALSQACLIIAVQLTKNTGTVTMVGSVAVIYSYLLSVFRYGENFNAFCALGTALIIIGVYQIVKKKSKVVDKQQMNED